MSLPQCCCHTWHASEIDWNNVTTASVASSTQLIEIKSLHPSQEVKKWLTLYKHGLAVISIALAFGIFGIDGKAIIYKSVLALTSLQPVSYRSQMDRSMGRFRFFAKPLPKQYNPQSSLNKYLYAKHQQLNITLESTGHRHVSSHRYYAMDFVLMDGKRNVFAMLRELYGLDLTDDRCVRLLWVLCVSSFTVYGSGKSIRIERT